MSTGFVVKVKFLEYSSLADENGKVVKEFEEGKTYDLCATDARRWIRRERAMEVVEKVEKPTPAPPVAPEQKDVKVEDTDKVLAQEASDVFRPGPGSKRPFGPIKPRRRTVKKGK